MPTASSDVDGEQDGPGYAETNERDDDRHAQEAQEKECIERLVLKSVSIGDFPEGAKPIEQAGRESRRAFPSPVSDACQNSLCT